MYRYVLDSQKYLIQKILLLFALHFFTSFIRFVFLYNPYLQNTYALTRNCVMIFAWKLPRLDLIPTKGSLISEGILTLVTLPKKGAKSWPWAGSLNFPLFTVNKLFKFSVQGRDLAPFLAMWQKAKYLLRLSYL